MWRGGCRGSCRGVGYGEERRLDGGEGDGVEGDDGVKIDRGWDGRVGVVG